MPGLNSLRIKIYADGANIDRILALAANPLIKGFTTNPTLMRKAGVIDYEAFAQALLRKIPDRPVSFEVFADDFAEMERQAHTIASWGRNVYVKIPVTNTRREFAGPLIERLTAEAVASYPGTVYSFLRRRPSSGGLRGWRAGRGWWFPGTRTTSPSGASAGIPGHIRAGRLPDLPGPAAGVVWQGGHRGLGLSPDAQSRASDPGARRGLRAADGRDPSALHAPRQLP